MTKELKMVFESTNPEKLNQKAILKMADVDETLTGAQVLAEMQKLASFTFVVGSKESHVLVHQRRPVL